MVKRTRTSSERRSKRAYPFRTPLRNGTFTRRKAHKGGKYTDLDVFEETWHDVLNEYAELQFKDYISTYRRDPEKIREIIYKGGVPVTLNINYLENTILGAMTSDVINHYPDIFEALLSYYGSKSDAIEAVIEDNGAGYVGDPISVIDSILDFPDIDINEAANHILPWLFENDEELEDDTREIFEKIITNSSFDIHKYIGYVLSWLFNKDQEFDDNKRTVFKKLIDIPSFDINHETDKGQTLLMLAAEHGEEDLVELLLVKDDLDINKQDEEGSTALMLAAENGEGGIVDQLLNMPEIDLTLIKAGGFTAFQLAQNAGFNTIAEAIHALERKRGARSLAEVATFGKNNNGKKLPELPNNVLRHTAKFLRKRKGTRRLRRRR